MSTAVAATQYVPEFLADFVLSTDEQAATAANANDGPQLELIVSGPTTIKATCNKGNFYPGDLVGDVVAYRRLRARSLSGKPMDNEASARLREFDDRLRQSPNPDASQAEAMRSFYRYNCGFDAEIKCGVRGGTYRIEDISAGGVKAVGEHRFTPGDTATLVVDRGTETTHFPSRIAWVRGEAFGLMFAGAASVKPS